MSPGLETTSDSEVTKPEGDESVRGGDYVPVGDSGGESGESLQRAKEQFLADYERSVIAQFGDNGEIKIREKPGEPARLVSMEEYMGKIQAAVERADEGQLAKYRELVEKSFKDFGGRSEATDQDDEVLSEEDFEMLEVDEEADVETTKVRLEQALEQIDETIRVLEERREADRQAGGEDLIVGGDRKKSDYFTVASDFELKQLQKKREKLRDELQKLG